MAKLATHIPQQTTGNLFRVAVEEAQTNYQLMVDEMTAEIEQMRTIGMSDDAIYKSLKYDLDNDVGIFKRLSGGLERTMDKLVNRTTASERIAGLSDVKYKWQLDPSVAEHCDDCITRETMPSKTIIDWQAIGIPGSGATECGDYCMCALVEAI